MVGTITLQLEDESEFWSWCDAADRLNFTSLEDLIIACVRQQLKESDRYKLNADRQSIGLKTK